VSNQIKNSDIEWVRLQDMAANMLDAAKESDWQQLTELNELRKPILEEYFTNGAPTLDTELVRDRIHVLQAIEQQILQYTMAKRDNVAKKLQSLHQGKRVERAYSEHAAA